MSVDGRIILFLVFAFITAVLLVLRQGTISSLNDVMQIVINFLLVPMALATVALFIGVITRSDPMPLIRQGAYQIGFRQLVSFADAIPDNLQNNLAVADVTRLDTDGDGFNEWVVLYEFDLQDGRNPVQAVVYDNDRGNPPVIFPYALRPPDRDYLSEGASPVSVDLDQITDSPESEVMIQSATELNIFEFQQNSETWDFPRDAPARYQPIGFFRGNGGVSIDPSSKDVTVIDRNGFERSQLAIRSVYALNPARTSYVDNFVPTKLAAPVVSTIDFYQEPPDDILGTTFPEKIVLAFYIATCSGSDATLCQRASEGWEARDFLAEGSEAIREFDNGNASYFGLNDFAGTPNLSVSNLRYYPQLETDSDLLVEGRGRDVVTGEQAQFNVVDINFAVANNGSVVEEVARFEMRLVNGQWKIIGRLPLDIPELGQPIEVSQE